jgi:hypothetical protein
MNKATQSKLTSLAVVTTLVLLASAAPAQADWQDNSGNLDFGREDSTSNTLMIAGGALAVGVGVWALVRHSKKKKMHRLQREIIERRAQLSPVNNEADAPQVESLDDPELSFEEAVQRMRVMRATMGR